MVTREAVELIELVTLCVSTCLFTHKDVQEALCGLLMSFIPTTEIPGNNQVISVAKKWWISFFGGIFFIESAWWYQAETPGGMFSKIAIEQWSMPSFEAVIPQCLWPWNVKMLCDHMALGLHRICSTYKFARVLHFLCDIWPILVPLTNMFQGRNWTPPEFSQWLRPWLWD